FSYRSYFWMYFEEERSTTTVRCILFATTTALRDWPRTLSFPWKGQCWSVHAFVGTATSIPMSRAFTGALRATAGLGAGGAGTFLGLGAGAAAGVFASGSFFAVSPHLAFFVRSSGRNRISSPSTSTPPCTSNRN